MKPDDMAIAAFASAMKLSEPKLAKALADAGVTSPDQLPPGKAWKMFQEAMLGTAAEHFPQARIDALRHGMSAFGHPAFSQALPRVQSLLANRFDAFAVATGVDQAIILAGFGLPVAPFDRKHPRILAEPSNNIDVVTEYFSKWKTAMVGYSPCDAPFYILTTDCVRSMLTQIERLPALHEAMVVLKRGGGPSPTGPLSAFRHGLVLAPREPGDTISTIVLNNPNPQEGSVAMYAGWTIGGARMGTPNDGFIPVPLQFVHAALSDPEIAMWIWKPVGTKVILN